ncbi:MAG: hypothetical protein LBK75_08580 [Oscillospiraceae bacterium]|jgi:hypothetical protein|nr:hypothetical protein [Oscillospiraceae bacterium]
MLKREDYKAIKHMDKRQMSEYLEKIYLRGFAAGKKAGTAGENPDTALAEKAEPDSH